METFSDATRTLDLEIREDLQDSCPSLTKWFLVFFSLAFHAFNTFWFLSSSWWMELYLLEQISSQNKSALFALPTLRSSFLARFLTSCAAPIMPQRPNTGDKNRCGLHFNATCIISKPIASLPPNTHEFELFDINSLIIYTGLQTCQVISKFMNNHTPFSGGVTYVIQQGSLTDGASVVGWPLPVEQLVGRLA